MTHARSLAAWLVVSSAVVACGSGDGNSTSVTTANAGGSAGASGANANGGTGGASGTSASGAPSGGTNAAGGTSTGGTNGGTHGGGAGGDGTNTGGTQSGGTTAGGSSSGGSAGASENAGGGGAGGTSAGGTNVGGSDTNGGSAGDTNAVGGSAAGTDAGGTNAGGSSGVPDPSMDGPYTYAEIDDKTTVSTTNDSVAVHAAYPTGGPSSGPFPVVIVAHGFQLPMSQYYGYVRRLATFGYVAVAGDFPASLLSVNNVQEAKDLSGALDWATTTTKLAGLTDPNAPAGITGHSLGGKLAILAAGMDKRFGATITLDPVNSSMNCSAANCPDATTLLPLGIPTSFLGETTDSTGSFMPCAPAADNYETFYAKTVSPSFAVTVLGADHMSFLDDPSTCGIVCSLCKPATADHTKVISMAYAYVVAFYERNLRGITAYDDYLTGATASARYVTTGLATIETK